ncbi:MAG: sugar transferase, partial [Patescibacteria group bacterium]
MLNRSKARAIILFLSDIAALYFSLFLTLVLRYGWPKLVEQWILHLRPFSIVFALWLLIFYINGLYDPKKFKTANEFKSFFYTGLFTSAFLAAVFFYLIPYFGITPKTNLFILIIIFGLIDYWARKLLNQLFISKGFQTKLMLVGADKTTKELAEALGKIPQLGYQITLWLKEEPADKNPEQLKKIIKEKEIDAIILPAGFSAKDGKSSAKNSKLIYQLATAGIAVINLRGLYESALQKIPLAEIEENWIMEKVESGQKFIDIFKRIEDLAIAAAALVIILPVFAFLLPMMALISGFPLFYKQKRMGKNEKEFFIYKLRTMLLDAEAKGPQWSSGENDERITPLGNFLRKTHLDEIPQLYNILKGELSFVGPRPE